MRIGVISDTHGLLRNEVFTLFKDVDSIIHAGDVGGEEILIQLEALAPVHAVYGNTDASPLTQTLPASLSLTVEGVAIFVTHIGGTPSSFALLHPEVEQSDLVIFGHTHTPLCQEEGGILFFNPGSAGPRRFSLPITVGRVEIQGSEVKTEFLTLSENSTISR